MGEDKSLLPFGAYNTLTEFQYSRLKKIFSHVYISCKNPNKFDFSANFIEDEKNNTTYAPTLGFVSVFKNLQIECFFALSVDAPFIDEVIIKKILTADSLKYDATIAKTEFGIQPLCGIYHRSLYPQFLQMQNQNNHKLGYLLKNVNTHYVSFSDETAFLNLNHPEDYKQALHLLSII